MNRWNLVRLVLIAALFGPGATVRAQQALEIIALRHRTVEQVLPALQPLVEPGGTLSGSRGQLFLRASPANAAQIKSALAAIDRPSKRLEISVRFDDPAERERRAIGASGTLGSGGSRIDITAQDARRSTGERVDQRVQVLEGSAAMIYTGQAQPLRDFVTGFEVVPRLLGNTVTLEIRHQRPTQGGATTVSARLGEWTELGATAAQAARHERGIASASGMRANESRRVWLKVEELN